MNDGVPHGDTANRTASAVQMEFSMKTILTKLIFSKHVTYRCMNSNEIAGNAHRCDVRNDAPTVDGMDFGNSLFLCWCRSTREVLPLPAMHAANIHQPQHSRRFSANAKKLLFSALR